jgi:Ni,Fe-hydrogenase III small subunit/NAD-dependent dihydropyrimidine dehydrogenase PreA subunit
MVLKVFRFDASGCNGCDIEILSAVLNPEYGITGIEVVDAPEKAQAMIVTGGGNQKTAELLKEAYSKLQDPKLVISMGTCASSMCVFKEGYPMKGPVDTLVPVNYFVQGCPPRPQNLAMAIHALLKAENAHSGPVWLAPEGLRARIAHDSEKCTACGACVNMCPSYAIDLVEEDGKFKIIYHLWKCSFCGTCQQVCPEDAVKLTEDYVIQDAAKEGLVTTGEMERMACATCGKPHITKAQFGAVKARILGNAPGMGQAEIDESLSRCLDCKAGVEGQGAARKQMLSWAYRWGV